MENDLQRITLVIGKLREQFFVHDFEVVNNMLICRYTNEMFFPDEVVIESAFRFENHFTPDKPAAALYAITTKSSTQGILLNVFNIYSETEEFLKKVPVRQTSENEV